MKQNLRFSIFFTAALFCAAGLFSEGYYFQGKNYSTPKRIVSLGPAATEILFALGAGNQIVSRTDFCNYPPEAEKIPSIGGFDGKTVNIENIISQRPDFIYLFRVIHTHLEAPLKKYGISYYMSDATTTEDVIKEILTIGEITGHKSEAEKITADIQEVFQNIAQKMSLNATKPKSVYWEIWQSPFMTIGQNSFINSIIETAGAVNIFGDSPQSYPIVNEETIIKRNPDVIFIPSDSPLTPEKLCERKGWQNITAVKNKTVYKIDADITGRSGPRIKEAVQIVYSMVYGN